MNPETRKQLRAGLTDDEVDRLEDFMIALGLSSFEQDSDERIAIGRYEQEMWIRALGEIGA